MSREVEMEISGDAKNDTDKLAIDCYKMMKTMYQNEYSEILDIFYGIHISRITSKTDTILSDRPEPFSFLSLPIPPNKETPSLYDCIDEYCKKEELFGEDAWMNDNTNQKKTYIVGLYLELTRSIDNRFKRWNDDGNKIHKIVEAPLDDFNLIKYVYGYDKKKYIYELFGICNHSGISEGGHYTAVIKNANGKWYNYNDTMVNEVSDSEIITSQSYCFFYRKKNLINNIYMNITETNDETIKSTDIENTNVENTNVENTNVENTNVENTNVENNNVDINNIENDIDSEIKPVETGGFFNNLLKIMKENAFLIIFVIVLLDIFSYFHL